MELVYTSASYEGVNDSGTKAILLVKRVFSWHLLGHSSTDLLSEALQQETLLSPDKFVKICAAGLRTPFTDIRSRAFPLNLLQKSFFGKGEHVYRSNDRVTEWQVSLPALW